MVGSRCPGVRFRGWMLGFRSFYHNFQTASRSLTSHRVASPALETTHRTALPLNHFQPPPQLGFGHRMKYLHRLHLAI